MADESKTPLYEYPYCDDEEEMDRRISQVAFVAYQQAKMKGIPVARYCVSAVPRRTPRIRGQAA